MNDSHDRIITPLTGDLLRGALDLERTARGGLLPHRLPAAARARFDGDEELARAESQPSGVRVVFRTRATVVELGLLRTVVGYRGVPPAPDGAYDLHIDGEPTGRTTASGGDVVLVDLADGSRKTFPGRIGSVRFDGLPGREKDVEIWLPYTETAELIDLRTDAPVTAVAPSGRRVWLHHGSSISHGSAAGKLGHRLARPGRRGGGRGAGQSVAGRQRPARPVHRARPAGHPRRSDQRQDRHQPRQPRPDAAARLRPGRARVPRHHPRGAARHPAARRVARALPGPRGHPGPAAPDFRDGKVEFTALGDPAESASGKLTLRVVRAELARIVAERAASDPYLFHLDGRTLYGEADHAELPLPDRLHPDDATHRRMGERFERSPSVRADRSRWWAADRATGRRQPSSSVIVAWDGPRTLCSARATDSASRRTRTEFCQVSLARSPSDQLRRSSSAIRFG